jgi:hypothetical protein
LIIYLIALCALFISLTLQIISFAKAGLDGASKEGKRWHKVGKAVTRVIWAWGLVSTVLSTIPNKYDDDKLHAFNIYHGHLPWTADILASAEVALEALVIFGSWMMDGKLSIPLDLLSGCFLVCSLQRWASLPRSSPSRSIKSPTKSLQNGTLDFSPSSEQAPFEQTSGSTCRGSITLGGAGGREARQLLREGGRGCKQGFRSAISSSREIIYLLDLLLIP